MNSGLRIEDFEKEKVTIQVLPNFVYKAAHIEHFDRLRMRNLVLST